VSELVGAINIYPTCDGCFKGKIEYELAQTRKLIGSDELVNVRVCEKCYERLGRPALNTGKAQ
jgi:hypothetical protein